MALKKLNYWAFYPSVLCFNLVFSLDFFSFFNYFLFIYSQPYKSVVFIHFYHITKRNIFFVETLSRIFSCFSVFVEWKLMIQKMKSWFIFFILSKESHFIFDSFYPFLQIWIYIVFQFNYKGVSTFYNSSYIPKKFLINFHFSYNSLS